MSYRMHTHMSPAHSQRLEWRSVGCSPDALRMIRMSRFEAVPLPRASLESVGCSRSIRSGSGRNWSKKKAWHGRIHSYPPKDQARRPRNRDAKSGRTAKVHEMIWDERLSGSRGLAISQPPYDDLSKDDTIWGLKWWSWLVLIIYTYTYKYAVYIYMILYVLAPKSWYICRDGSSCEWSYLRKVETRWPSPGRR